VSHAAVPWSLIIRIRTRTRKSYATKYSYRATFASYTTTLLKTTMLVILTRTQISEFCTSCKLICSRKWPPLRLWSVVKLKFHGSSFLVASSKQITRMLRVSGDFPVQLATRLADWSAGGLLRCIVLPVCPCVMSFSKFHEPDTHDLLRT